jgi:hypothetical protein
MNAFGNSDEFNNRYGSLSNSELITQIYQQLYNREPDSGGLEHYTNLLDTGETNLQQITLNVMYGSQNEDLSKINNKLDAAKTFTNTLTSSGNDYPLDFATTYLSSVTEDQTTITTVASSLNTYLGISEETPIEDKETEEALVKKAALVIHDAFESLSADNLTTYIDTERFMDEGTDWNYFSQLGDFLLHFASAGRSIKYTKKDVVVSKVEGLEDTYRALFITSSQTIDNSGNIISESIENETLNPFDMVTGAIVDKTSGEWKLIGDQLKSEYDFNLRFDGNTVTFDSNVEATTNEIESVVISSSVLETPQTFEKNGNEFKNTITSDNICGAPISLSVNYADGSNETTSFKSPDCPANLIFPTFSDAKKLDDGRLNLGVSYSGIDNISSITLVISEINLSLQIPLSWGGIALPASHFNDGNNYTLILKANDLYGRQFVSQATITY